MMFRAYWKALKGTLTNPKESAKNPENEAFLAYKNILNCLYKSVLYTYFDSSNSKEMDYTALTNQQLQYEYANRFGIYTGPKYDSKDFRRDHVIACLKKNDERNGK